MLGLTGPLEPRPAPLALSLTHLTSAFEKGGGGGSAEASRKVSGPVRLQIVLAEPCSKHVMLPPRPPVSEHQF